MKSVFTWGLRLGVPVGIAAILLLVKNHIANAPILEPTATDYPDGGIVVQQELRPRFIKPWWWNSPTKQFRIATASVIDSDGFRVPCRVVCLPGAPLAPNRPNWHQGYLVASATLSSMRPLNLQSGGTLWLHLTVKDSQVPTGAPLWEADWSAPLLPRKNRGLQLLHLAR